MQLTNGALKKHLANQAVALGEKGNVVFESEADYEELDLSAFMAPVVSKKDGQLRPSDSAAKITEAEKFLGESESLYQLGVKYETEVVARGHKALYELLASIYSLALRIEDNLAKEQILELMRKNLKEKFDIKINKNASPISAIVRYVVRTDKMSASRYSKALEVARQENLSAEELPAYIARRGGVSQIQETEAKCLAKKEGSKTSKDRLALIREYFELLGYASKTPLTYDGEMIVFNEEKDTAAETSSFCFFMAHYDGDNQYRIITANDLGKSFEDNIIKFLGKAMPNDLHVLERGVRNQKKKLMMDESLPKALRDNMREQLAKPYSYKQNQVIEMDEPQETEE
ncbi:hypothetical protein [Polynucleobacter sphagniphilus]|uniref:hypothetical protein n=1 Tax=Polynucleobacter sphagniphilus TaxID=1743169 RepID=UPI0024069F1E|nr:hypothetical protein [Polynucleobacter sphagniphilus]MDF9787820.1 hypothetical protein [Polynucleobacter sphagniphilus]